MPADHHAHSLPHVTTLTRTVGPLSGHDDVVMASSDDLAPTDSPRAMQTAIRIAPAPRPGVRSAVRGLLSTILRADRSCPEETPLTEGSADDQLRTFRAMHPTGLVVLVQHREQSEAPDALAPAEAVAAGAGVVIAPSPHGRLTVDFHQRQPVIRLADSDPTAWHVTLAADPDRPGRHLLRVRPALGTTAGQEVAAAYDQGLRTTNHAEAYLERVEVDSSTDGDALLIRIGRSGAVRKLHGTAEVVRSGWDDDTAADFTVTAAGPTTTRVIAHELTVRGFDAEILSPNFVVGTSGTTRVAYAQSSTHHAPFTSVKAVGDKHIARRILAAAGLSVARGAFYASRKDLPAALSQLEQQGSVVVKPVDGSSGRGVTVGVRTADALRDAWTEAFGVSQSGVLIEKMFSGSEVRFAVAGDACIAATLRVPPAILGDGTSTIRELVNTKNAERRLNPHLVDRPITLDRARLDRLAEHGKSPLSVLPAGEEYVIDYRAGFSMGAESVDVTDDIHPSYREIAVAAVHAIPAMTVAGVDILITDPEVPATRENHIIIELNSQPGIGSHHFPVRGQARNVGGAIVDLGIADEWTPSTHLELPESALDRSAEREPDARSMAAQFEARGFAVDWLSPGYFHAERDGITTDVWGTYTSLTGKSAVTAARIPDIARVFLEKSSLPVPADQRSFYRDAPGTGFRHGRKAREYAATLPSAVLRTDTIAPVAVDPGDPRSFRAVWEQICRKARGHVVVERAPEGEHVRFLVAYGETISVLRPGGASAAAAVHPSYAEVAVEAAAAFPGLDIAEVLIAVTEVQAPADTARHTVILVRPRPGLAAHQRAAGEETSIAGEIVERHVHALTRKYADGRRDDPRTETALPPND